MAVLGRRPRRSSTRSRRPAHLGAGRSRRRDTFLMDARAITEALCGRWQGRYGLCRCPAHNDKNPSLKISDDPHKLDGIDLICFAGCAWQDVKIELTQRGLLTDFRCSNAGLLTSLLSQAATPKNDEAERLR